MPHSFGYRARTRDMYSKKKGGMPKPTTYLKVFKIGDYIDVLCDPAIHKGMPHREYYGKTGRVWNVTKRAVGVELFRLVRDRLRTKKFHVRVEHIRASKSRVGHLERVKHNDEYRKQVHAAKKDPSLKVKPKSLKRQPVGPRGGYVLKKRSCRDVRPMW